MRSFHVGLLFPSTLQRFGSMYQQHPKKAAVGVKSVVGAVVLQEGMLFWKGMVEAVMVALRIGQQFPISLGVKSKRHRLC